MAGRFRLTAVLRARQAQEDTAKATVVRARGTIRAAQRAAGHTEAALRASGVPEGGAAKAVVAALAARRSMAGNLFAAQQAIGAAEQDTTDRVAELAEAAKRRKVVEGLAERHAAAVKADELAADQRTIDELAISAGQRRAALGPSPAPTGTGPAEGAPHDDGGTP